MRVCSWQIWVAAASPGPPAHHHDVERPSPCHCLGHRCLHLCLAPHVTLDCLWQSVKCTQHGTTVDLSRPTCLSVALPVCSHARTASPGLWQAAARHVAGAGARASPWPCGLCQTVLQQLTRLQVDRRQPEPPARSVRPVNPSGLSCSRHAARKALCAAHQAAAGLWRARVAPAQVCRPCARVCNVLTSAPCAARTLPHASPMPRAPPVIRATRPASLVLAIRSTKREQEP